MQQQKIHAGHGYQFILAFPNLRMAKEKGTRKKTKTAIKNLLL